MKFIHNLAESFVGLFPVMVQVEGKIRTVLMTQNRNDALTLGTAWRRRFNQSSTPEVQCSEILVGSEVGVSIQSLLNFKSRMIVEPANESSDEWYPDSTEVRPTPIGCISFNVENDRPLVAREGSDSLTPIYVPDRLWVIVECRDIPEQMIETYGIVHARNYRWSAMFAGNCGDYGIRGCPCGTGKSLDRALEDLATRTNHESGLDLNRYEDFEVIIRDYRHRVTLKFPEKGGEDNG